MVDKKRAQFLRMRRKRSSNAHVRTLCILLIVHYRSHSFVIIQARELRYQSEQAREGLKSSENVNSQLRAQLEKMESRLSKEIEARQAAEYRRREVEIAQRGLAVAHQQLQEELADVSTQLQSEKEAKRLQECLYKEQIKLFQSLQVNGAV